MESGMNFLGLRNIFKITLFFAFVVFFFSPADVSFAAVIQEIRNYLSSSALGELNPELNETGVPSTINLPFRDNIYFWRRILVDVGREEHYFSDGTARFEVRGWVGDPQARPNDPAGSNVCYHGLTFRHQAVFMDIFSRDSDPSTNRGDKYYGSSKYDINIGSFPGANCNPTRSKDDLPIDVTQLGGDIEYNYSYQIWDRGNFPEADYIGRAVQNEINIKLPKPRIFNEGAFVNGNTLNVTFSADNSVDNGGGRSDRETLDYRVTIDETPESTNEPWTQIPGVDGFNVDSRQDFQVLKDIRNFSSGWHGVYIQVRNRYDSNHNDAFNIRNDGRFNFTQVTRSFCRNNCSGPTPTPTPTPTPSTFDVAPDEVEAKFGQQKQFYAFFNGANVTVGNTAWYSLNPSCAAWSGPGNFIAGSRVCNTEICGEHTDSNGRRWEDCSDFRVVYSVCRSNRSGRYAEVGTLDFSEVEGSNRIHRGETKQVSIEMRNCGTIGWSANQRYRLGTAADQKPWGQNRARMSDADPDRINTWLNKTPKDTVIPEESINFMIDITAPANPADWTYERTGSQFCTPRQGQQNVPEQDRVYFCIFQGQMVQDGVAWFLEGFGETIDVYPATLDVNLTANPTSGAPGTNVNLSADVSGTATGTINYTFWWNCNNPTTSVAEAIAACGDPDGVNGNSNGIKFDNVNDDPKSVSHIYNTPGTFTAKVIVERGAAPPDEDRETITITNGNPEARNVQAVQLDYCVSPTYRIEWTYTDPDGNPSSAYQVQVNDLGSSWNPPLEDDSGIVSSSVLSGTRQTYTIPPGKLAFGVTYKARVKVWDSNNTESSWYESSNWRTPDHAYPQVNFTWSPQNPIVDQSVNFTDQTTFYDSSNPGQRRWDWSFDDPDSSGSGGPSATQQNPTYVFRNSGVHNVRLRATDSDNFSCEIVKDVNVGSGGIFPFFKEIIPGF